MKSISDFKLIIMFNYCKYILYYLKLRAKSLK